MDAMAGSQFSEFEGGPGGSRSDRRGVRCGRLIVVAGLPAAGKTTVARALERDLRAIRLCADDWMIELGIDLLDVSARTPVEQLQWRLAQRLLELGAVVVIESGTWSRPSAMRCVSARVPSAPPSRLRFSRRLGELSRRIGVARSRAYAGEPRTDVRRLGGRRAYVVPVVCEIAPPSSRPAAGVW